MLCYCEERAHLSLYFAQAVITDLTRGLPVILTVCASVKINFLSELIVKVYPYNYIVSTNIIEK